MGKFGKELIESMQQAGRHAADKKVRGLRVSKVELPDVKAIRLSTGGSESEYPLIASPGICICWR